MDADLAETFEKELNKVTTSIPKTHLEFTHAVQKATKKPLATRNNIVEDISSTEKRILPYQNLRSKGKQLVSTSARTTDHFTVRNINKQILEETKKSREIYLNEQAQLVNTHFVSNDLTNAYKIINRLTKNTKPRTLPRMDPNTQKK